jgi:Na+-transporting NADH:ubiquinone oxidoreductase subunit F
MVKHDCPKPYNGIIEAYMEIIPALLKQSKEPSYFVERKLPETASKRNVQSKNIFTGDPGRVIDDRIEVCALSDLPPGEVVRFDFDQKTYAVYRTSDNQFYATDGICTHGNAHLGDGVIIGDMIECPKHNGRFSLKDGTPRRDPVCVGINTYAVDTTDGIIYLNLAPVNKAAGAREFSYTVISNRNVTPYVKELVLMPAGNDQFVYSAGQYIQLVIPPHQIRFTVIEVDEPFRKDWESRDLYGCYSENALYLKRNYSMATNPASGSQLIFNVRIALPPEGMNVPAGAGSSYVFGLQPGEVVKLAGPFGDFRIKHSEREMIYMGGGAGMAPLRSHLSYLFDTERTKRKVSFWYGARTPADLYYRDYFENLQLEHENFSFHFAFSDPAPGDNAEGHTGFVHEVLYREYLENHPGPALADYYLCGPPAMIEAGLEMLQKMGVPQDNIAYDAF